MVANGGAVDGIRLLSPDTIDLIFHEQSSGTHLVLGLPIRFGLGYALEVAARPYIPVGRVCFWGGWGGSIAINDLERNLRISYVMNKMSPGLGAGPGRSSPAGSRAVLRAVLRGLAPLETCSSTAYGAGVCR